MPNPLAARPATPDDTGGLARLVAEHAPSILVYFDAELRVRFVNRHCYELLGRAPRDILGRPLAELVDARTLRYALAHVDQVEGGDLAPRNYVLFDRHGARVFVKVQAVPYRDHDGRCIGYFACTSDNSAERSAQAALSAAQERLRFALAACEAGIWEWDLAAQRVHYAEEFASLLGYAEDGLPPHFGFFAALHADDAEPVFDAIAAAIQDGGTFDREFRMRCADGGYRWLRGVGRAVRDPRTRNPLRFTGTLRDISPRKQAEHHLREASDLVNESLDGFVAIAEPGRERSRLDRVRRELVAAASHELRTPLASIIAALELLCEDGAPEAKHPSATFLHVALRNAERLARVVEQWLDVERIDLGITPLRPEALDFGALAARVVADCARGARQHSVRVDLSTGPGSVHVSSDPERLQLAVAHLVGGAIDRSPPGATVRVRVEARAEAALLELEDEGPAVFTGADLGLSLAKAIVERLGGTLRCGARPGTGAHYHLQLTRIADGH
jgi:PAS domain S-box-containing protein